MKKEDILDIMKIAAFAIFKLLTVAAILILAILFYNNTTKTFFHPLIYTIIKSLFHF